MFRLNCLSPVLFVDLFFCLTGSKSVDIVTLYQSDMKKHSTNITNDMWVFADLLPQLKWRKFLIFYDNTKENEYRNFLLTVEKEVNGRQPTLVTFETSALFWEKIEENLNIIHDQFFPKINVIVMCSEGNTSELINSVITADLRTGSQLDYRHNSFWLLLMEVWTERLKNMSVPLENVAIVMANYTARNRDVLLPWPHEDTYIYSAHGMNAARQWRWLSYSSIKHDIYGKPAFLLVYPNTEYGHNGRELRVAVRHSLGCLYKTFETNQTIYKGYCMDLFNDIASSLNFSYTVIASNDTEYGVEINGSWTGIVGQLQRGEADIGVTDVSHIPQRKNAVSYISPNMKFQEHYMLYRQGAKVLKLFRFLDPFKREVYLVLFSALILVPLAYFIIEIYLTDAASPRLSDVFFYFGASIFQQGGRLRPTSWTARALTSTFWLCSICLAATYSAYLTASLAVTSYDQPFTDLRGLIQRKDYKVGITTVGATLTVLKNSRSGINKELWGRIYKDNQSDPSVIDANLTNQMSKVLQEKYAVLVEAEIALVFTAMDCRLTYIKDSVLWKMSSFIVRKGSPYKHDIDKVMGHHIDSDTLSYYKEREFNETKICQPASVTSVSKEYLIGIVSCLLIGFAASALVLIAEIVYNKKYK